MPNQPSQGESNFGDSSGRLFTIYIYHKAAEEEDNKMVKRWKEDAKGILIFVSPSCRYLSIIAHEPVLVNRNAIDRSILCLSRWPPFCYSPGPEAKQSRYLRTLPCQHTVYQVLADPNLTRTSTPPPVVKPSAFSPPRYAVWVNSLWFLSLVMSLSRALWATSLQQWARRYLDRSQPPRCSPEKRARMRALFASVDKMHIPRAVEGLPALLHRCISRCSFSLAG